MKICHVDQGGNTVRVTFLTFVPTSKTKNGRYATVQGLLRHCPREEATMELDQSDDRLSEATVRDHGSACASAAMHRAALPPLHDTAVNGARDHRVRGRRGRLVEGGRAS